MRVRALLLLPPLENGQGKERGKREGEEASERWIALERRGENEKRVGKGRVSAVGIKQLSPKKEKILV